MSAQSKETFGGSARAETKHGAPSPRQNVPEGPTRPEIEGVLREAGLSHRQARKLLAIGWKGVVGERQAEDEELRQRLAELEERLKQGT